MEILDHYKESYHKELERVKDLEGSLSIPTGIVTLLSTILIYYLTNFDYSYSLWLTIFFLICIAPSSFFLVCSIINFWKGYNITSLNKNYRYDFLPSLKEQNDYYDNVVKYYSSEKFLGQDSKALAKDAFIEYLKDTYVATATNNINMNVKYAGFLFKGKQMLFKCLICFLITLLPFGINYVGKPSHPVAVEIKN